MYGDCSDERFLRFEPGGDNAVELLYTWDMEGKLTGVAVNVPCPSQVFELHRFLTADYWGFVREDLKQPLGEVFVLPFCGAAGDLSPIDLVQISKHNREELRLWGGQAQKKAPLLEGGAAPRLILQSAHPSPLSSYRGFFGSRPFSRANAFLRAHGEREIDWRLPE